MDSQSKNKQEIRGKKSKSPASWWFSTPLKNISQNGNLPQIGVIIKSTWKPPPRPITSSPKEVFPCVKFFLSHSPHWPSSSKPLYHLRKKSFRINWRMEKKLLWSCFLTCSWQTQHPMHHHDNHPTSLLLRTLQLAVVISEINTASLLGRPVIQVTLWSHQCCHIGQVHTHNLWWYPALTYKKTWGKGKIMDSKVPLKWDRWVSREGIYIYIYVHLFVFPKCFLEQNAVFCLVIRKEWIPIPKHQLNFYRFSRQEWVCFWPRG